MVAFNDDDDDSYNDPMLSLSVCVSLPLPNSPPQNHLTNGS